MQRAASRRRAGQPRSHSGVADRRILSHLSSVSARRRSVVFLSSRSSEAEKDRQDRSSVIGGRLGKSNGRRPTERSRLLPEREPVTVEGEEREGDVGGPGAAAPDGDLEDLGMTEGVDSLRGQIP
jgi:hypothetical protein